MEVYFVFFHVFEEGWVRRGGKGEEYFGVELFVRITFPEKGERNQTKKYLTAYK